MSARKTDNAGQNASQATRTAPALRAAERAQRQERRALSARLTSLRALRWGLDELAMLVGSEVGLLVSRGRVTVVSL